MSLLSSENIGTNLNTLPHAMLHPDRHQGNPINKEENENRKETRNTWFPTRLLGNKQLKHGDEFTATGLKAIYIRDNYAVGYARSDMAFLEIVS